MRVMLNRFFKQPYNKLKIIGGTMITKLNKLVKSKLGQGMTEWILIVSLIAIGAMAGFKAIQGNMKTTLETQGKKIMDSVK